MAPWVAIQYREAATSWARALLPAELVNRPPHRLVDQAVIAWHDDADILCRRDIPARSQIRNGWIGQIVERVDFRPGVFLCETSAHGDIYAQSQQRIKFAVMRHDGSRSGLSKNPLRQQ